MKRNVLTTCGVLAITILLMLNLATTIFQPDTVFAENKNAIGRYQVSAWASPSKGAIQFAGYYVIDTTTGKIVEKHSERLRADQ